MLTSNELTAGCYCHGLISVEKMLLLQSRHSQSTLNGKNKTVSTKEKRNEHIKLIKWLRAVLQLA